MPPNELSNSTSTCSQMVDSQMHSDQIKQFDPSSLSSSSSSSLTAPVSALVSEAVPSPPLSPSSSSSSPNEPSLTSLISDIHKVLGPDQGLDSKNIDAGEIIRLMEQYSSNSKDWAKYAMFDHSRAYTRNLIDDGNGKFNLMILAWSKNQQSPIHNHSGSHCIMKILDGELQETLYDWPNRVEESGESADITAAVVESKPSIDGGVPLNVSRDTMYHANQVTYVHGKVQPLYN